MEANFLCNERKLLHKIYDKNAENKTKPYTNCYRWLNIYKQLWNSLPNALILNSNNMEAFEAKLKEM